MRADRLLAMLMLLQNRGRMTAREIAAELEVSERTIYRDINALGTAGVPIYAERGPGGGVRLIERYRSDLTGLTKNQVQALFMLSIPPALSDLGLDQELKAALFKLAAALPAALRDDPNQIRQRIYIDPQPQATAKSTSNLPHLLTVQQAVWEEQVLELTYGSILGDWVGPLNARFHPYGLVSQGGYWYLVGQRTSHMAVIRVDFILDARLTAEAIMRPHDFDLVDFWEAWRQDEASNRPDFPVRLRISPKIKPYLSALQRFGIQEDVFEVMETDSMGWIALDLHFETHEQALERLLPFGGSIEVLEPIALRYSIRDYAGQILAVYS
jgi:predicted DNA-binding transcriptional regulator YafY